MGWSFIGNVVVHCAGGVWIEESQRVEGEPRALGEFYAELLGLQIIRDDWIKVGKDRTTYPQLAIDGIKDHDSYRPPRWPDPNAPQQIHLDLTVPDVEAAADRAVERGATRLRDRADAVVLADPAGHPFCLLQAEKRRIQRIVFDCFSPRSVAPFYEELLEMERVDDSPELVVLARRDRRGPMVAFQHVRDYAAPRPGDDRFHQQLHLDIWFEDAEGATETAQRLGGILLDRRPHPVVADPAGHPFCILRLGQ
jgi:catechol 2,3-dioxygenase-like lactoylglutathione lyase family enzyme